MTVARYILYLHEAIGIQRFAFRFHLAMACVTFALGVAALVLGIFCGESILNGVRIAITAGGGLCSAVAAIPLVPLIKRREKLGALHFLLREFQTMNPQASAEQDPHVQELEEMVRTLMKRQLEG